MYVSFFFTYLEWSQDDFIGLISGQLAGGNIANEPSDALGGFKLADDGERGFNTKRLGAGNLPLLSVSTEEKAKANTLNDNSSSKKTSDSRGRKEGGRGGGNSGGSGGVEDKRQSGQGGGRQCQSEDQSLVHVEMRLDLRLRILLGSR